MNDSLKITDRELLDIIDSFEYPTSQELFNQIEPDQIRIRNRLLDVLETNPEGEECQLLRTQLQQLNELIFIVLNDPVQNNSKSDELYSELLKNGGITPMGIQDPEHKVVSLAQERYKITTANL